MYASCELGVEQIAESWGAKFGSLRRHDQAYTNDRNPRCALLRLCAVASMWCKRRCKRQCKQVPVQLQLSVAQLVCVRTALRRTRRLPSSFLMDGAMTAPMADPMTDADKL